MKSISDYIINESSLTDVSDKIIENQKYIHGIKEWNKLNSGDDPIINTYINDGICVPNIKFAGNDISYMFSNQEGITELDLDWINFRKSLIYVEGLCMNDHNLETFKLSELNAPGVQSLKRLFHDCHSLKHISLRGWEVGHIFDATRMFSGCEKIQSINLSTITFNEGRNITTGMFARCGRLERVNLGDYTAHISDSIIGLDKRSFAYIRYHDGMFDHCGKLKSVRFNSIDICPKCSIFVGCDGLESIYGEVRLIWPESPSELPSSLRTVNLMIRWDNASATPWTMDISHLTELDDKSIKYFVENTEPCKLNSNIVVPRSWNISEDQIRELIKKGWNVTKK